MDSEAIFPVDLTSKLEISKEERFYELSEKEYLILQENSSHFGADCNESMIYSVSLYLGFLNTIIEKPDYFEEKKVFITPINIFIAAGLKKTMQIKDIFKLCYRRFELKDFPLNIDKDTIKLHESQLILSCLLYSKLDLILKDILIETDKIKESLKQNVWILFNYLRLCKNVDLLIESIDLVQNYRYLVSLLLLLCKYMNIKHEIDMNGLLLDEIEMVILKLVNDGEIIVHLDLNFANDSTTIEQDLTRLDETTGEINIVYEELLREEYTLQKNIIIDQRLVPLIINSNTKILQSPTYRQHTSYMLTPLSFGMASENWLIKLLSCRNSNSLDALLKSYSLDIEDRDLIKRWFNQICTKVGKNIRHRESIIEGLFLLIIERTVDYEIKRLESQGKNLIIREFVCCKDLMYSLLSLTLIIIGICHSVSNLSYYQLKSRYTIDPLDLLKTIDNFFKIFPDIILNLKVELHKLMVDLIKREVFLENSKIFKFMKILNDNNGNCTNGTYDHTEEIKSEQLEFDVENTPPSKSNVNSAFSKVHPIKETNELQVQKQKQKNLKNINLQAIHSSVYYFFYSFQKHCSKVIVELLDVLINNKKQLEMYYKQIMKVLVEIFTNNFDLFKNRHLHTILLCCVYITIRANKVEETFTNIVKSYKSIPSFDVGLDVYRSINLNDGEFGDIIKFYNNNFVPICQIMVKQIVESSLKLKVPAFDFKSSNEQANKKKSYNNNSEYPHYVAPTSTPIKKLSANMSIGFGNSRNLVNDVLSPSTILSCSLSIAPSRHPVFNTIGVNNNKKINKHESKRVSFNKEEDKKKEPVL
eukprot:TRINITY_DN3157_c3_g2_i1.p1 TRINITY_DN3157_c3_g2~~TRINITY_DN3157_c3_g2_i1.p1  ORF type:complete len:815 (+),score=188.62 TRINITY_DN3157_c3_g2_i1:66-2510(+)